MQGHIGTPPMPSSTQYSPSPSEACPVPPSSKVPSAVANPKSTTVTWVGKGLNWEALSSVSVVKTPSPLHLP